MMKVKKIIFLLLCFLSPLFLLGQNVSLADHYFKNGEYAKALDIYETLYDNTRSTQYFVKIIEIYKELREYESARTKIAEKLKSDPRALELYVQLGDIEEMQGNVKKAQSYYNTAIDKLTNNRAQITRLANAFTGLGKYAETIRTMEKGGKLLKNETIFAMSLAEFSRREGEKEKMVKYYLLALKENPVRLGSIKILLDRYLEEEDLDLVQTYIYNEISSGASDEVYAELLSWVAIQREDYKTAFRQLRALDIRLNENGSRVYKLGDIARSAEDYETALMAFNYIIDNKASNSTYFIPAHMARLNTQIAMVKSGSDGAAQYLDEIDNAYDSLLVGLGENPGTVHLMVDQADFNAYQIGNIEKAITILNRVIGMRTANPRVRAQAKIELADLLLIRGEKWDATLLYSQVDKDFPEEELGEQARFKNAMLSYYTGEYEWAKEQFDILKAATSRFYSNDAIDMSVFIADNLNLDTTAVPLQMYAEAEFLVFQNRDKEALGMLDSLMLRFPDHSLDDDILYLKGNIYKDREEYELAIEHYTRVVDDYPEEIRADNALYALALIYDKVMDDKESALSAYEKLFMDYQDSVFAVYARKRFRELRGDVMQ